MGLVARVLLTILRLYVWFIMAIFGLLLLSFVAALLPARVGENAGPSGAPVSLPPTASDVSFYAPPPFGPAEACEFSVSEEAFLAWASDRHLSLKPLGRDGLDVPDFSASFRQATPKAPFISRTDGATSGSSRIKEGCGLFNRVGFPVPGDKRV